MNRENLHNEDFLKSITQNDHGFSTPKNYLDSIEESIMCGIIEDSFPKDSSYKVPNDYFNTVEDKIYAKLNAPTKEVKVISLRQRLLQAIPMAAAASVLLFIGLNYFSTSENYTFDSISTDELEVWLDENYSLSTPLEFVDADFTDSNIIENENSLEDEDILDYFNTIDNTSLLTEIDS
jgi:hypothetical protein